MILKTYNTSSIMCYLLPVNKNLSTVAQLDNDVIIQQDIINKEWKAKLTLDAKNFLLKQRPSSNETIYFSITSKFDPNIFYRSLEFNISDLISNNIVSIPFKYSVEETEGNISIYTAKYFNNYIHEINQ